VHNIVDNICGSFFAVTGADLPAEVFLHYMADGSAFKKLGFAPGGTIEVWKPLAEYVSTHGGQVWLDSPATCVLIENGHAVGATIGRAGETITVTAAAVVSNIGPGNTARLIDPSALPPDYARTIDATTTFGTILTVHFVSPEPLADWPAIGLATRSRRLTYLYNCSAPAQRRIRRPGWHLYAAAATPRPATGPVDVEQEKQLLLDDLRDHLPGFDKHATILAWDINDEHNPAQRSVTGYDHPVDTPIPNLWNVGDGVKPWGDAGTSACVRTADTVVSRILATQTSRTSHTGV
jgi:phytoene dehydrogenase-like protein